ncbi:dynein regulatory complex subunit 3 isoform X2 [Latimeria chalumnae]|uniref:dynein regulatory complex subunit 3 isoform X2 n=1 Tax=Latimeria chalumnae TaxID=7897 RepID=UPI00313EAF38
MSRLYDTIEPNVIDEEMLLKAVEEQGPKEEAGKIAKKEGIDFNDVTHLRLDFRNILKIDNLWRFVKLTKLQMDNNIIEKIEGLDCLTNLVWLDLSFNNIEVIEGLDALLKLEDLTLYNNRISRLENMDTLTNLQVFSVGNNCINQLENIVYLRRFKHLRTLNLAGNAISEDEQYKMFVAAHLPDLVYLDFRLIDEHSRDVGNQQYQYAIEELRQDERAALVKQEEERLKQEELDLHKAAYVEYLNGPFLFDSMFAEDADGVKLACLPGVADLLEAYKTKFVAICQQIFEYGLQQYEKREDEVKTFHECIQEAIKDNQDMGSKLIREFEDSKSEVFHELQNITDNFILEAKIQQYCQEINQLSDDILSKELQLVDQLEEVIKDFERNISDIVAGFIENVQGFVVQCRDLENHHHEKLLEICVHTLDKVVKTGFDEDIPESLRKLFVDKDTLVNAVGASHDLHLQKIDNKEDEIVTRANTWLSSLIEKIHSSEVERNRKRVSEVHNYIGHLQDELDSLDLQETV